MSQQPDFARTDVSPLTDRDLRFLIENFPAPGGNYEEIARLIHELPTTVESMLDSDYVLDRILARRELLLDISPFLLFNVLLRRSLDGHRNKAERSIINYLANLLSLFVSTERMQRVASGDEHTHGYLVSMIEEAEGADPRRKFLIYAHIGNFALFLTGMFPQWIEHRHRFGRRSVDMKFYSDFGRAYFDMAAGHPLAEEYRLDSVFFRLSYMFDDYQQAMNRMARDYLCA